MTRPAAVLTALALTLLSAALVVRAGTTPAPVPATAPVTDFSAERALRHEQVIAERPHPTGSEANARVREYIVAQLRALGLEPQLQEATAVGTRYPVAGHIINVIARLPGRVPWGKAVLIAAHYDGVWASPAAGDDGAGTAALLETLRALRAGAPLEHDVIALFTDAEESGLLGAAAFVREHPWVRDVAVTLDFEARGTTGRSLMFETGAGNLDAVRVLRTLPDVSAGSLMVTVYRSLPNDTDLSEYSQLNQPALNFAFVGGVERYHTSHDDLAHLNAGSVQHHGVQMLALARAFGNGPLPRPVTGDAIFFDVPFIGIVMYAEAWSVPIAVLVAAIVLALVVRRTRREPHWGSALALGAAGMIVTACVGGFVVLWVAKKLDALHAAMAWHGHPSWRPVYAVALALLALGGAAGAWSLLRRWASAAALHAGALVVWTVLVLATALRLPGTSYLFAWPVAAVALAAWADGAEATTRFALIARWAATIVACAVLVPVLYVTGGYTLPLSGPGGIAVGAIVPMLAWLLAPHLETMGGERRWDAAALFAAASLALFAYGAATVRPSDAQPTATNLAYLTGDASDSAWLTMPRGGARDRPFAEAAFGSSPRMLPPYPKADSSTRWLYAAGSSVRGLVVRSMPRTITDLPDATVLADSVDGGKRRLTIRFRAPHGTLSYIVNGAAWMRTVAVDGRAVDTTRYRRVPRTLTIPFTAPPDSGFTVVVELPRDSAATLRLAAVSPGLPAMPGITVPARPADVVPIQNGDVTMRTRRVELATSPMPTPAKAPAKK